MNTSFGLFSMTFAETGGLHDLPAAGLRQAATVMTIRRNPNCHDHPAGLRQATVMEGPGNPDCHGRPAPNARKAVA